MITRRLKVALLSVLTVGTCTVAVPAQSATPLPSNGSFVSYQGRAYTVAGKALLPIFAWA